MTSRGFEPLHVPAFEFKGHRLDHYTTAESTCSSKPSQSVLGFLAASLLSSASSPPLVLESSPIQGGDFCKASRCLLSFPFELWGSWGAILAEGAIALSVTLSGGALFAS